MIKERIKRPGDKRLLTAIVAAVLVLLTAVYVTLEILINAGIISLGASDPGKEKKPLKDGEAYYGNSTVAYPTFNGDKIQLIDIDAENGSFSLLRHEKNEEFTIYYKDDNGETVPYVPPIMGAENTFDYSQLFAFDNSVGISVPKITYLTVAIGTLYFNERIELDDSAREQQLARYGLDEGNYDTITVSYLDANGKEQAHVIKVGNALLTGSGYYYMVDDRDYVYTSSGKGLDYALGGVEAFLHSRVLAAGLASDGAYEPYLTTCYKQWKHKVHNTEGNAVLSDSEVVLSATRISPSYDSNGDTDGYLRQKYNKLSMDLSMLSGREEYNRAVAILLSSAVGSYAENPLLLTVLADRLEVKLTEGVSDEYTYEIVAVESVITEGGEVVTPGYAVGTADLVKVSYNLKIGGTRVNEKLYHGVFDISSESGVPDDVKSALRASSVGDLPTAITYSKVYTEANAVRSNYEYVITDIVAIYDASYNVASKIDADSKVNYRYVIRVNGKVVGEETQETVDLAKITEGDNLKVKQKLIGKSAESDLNLVAFSDERYGQDVFGFITYEVDEIKYFVTREIITSFKFVNAVDRDPFFGESLYQNTLENENKGYALNSEACERVVKILGGIGASTSDGLLGNKTVAIGLTPTNMEEYGLYANSIYFELPRGITTYTDPTGSGYTSIDSYTYLSTIGFYLYISDEKDGKRYVGSDMYDIIVEMDASVFEFVEHSFVEYWARRSLVMLNYQHIDYVDLSFSMSDLYGSYKFDFNHITKYIGSDGVLHNSKPESGGTEYDFVTIDVTPHGEASEEGNKLLDLLRENIENNPTLENIDSIELHNLYRDAEGKLSFLGDDYAGTAYFKEQLLILFSTFYTGILTEEEQEAAFASAEKLMSISFAVDTSRAGPAASPYPYVYDFYRVSDRRVMVVIREVGPNGMTLSQVSDFYISQFAFRKIVNNFQKLLNGEVVDQDNGY